MATVRALAPKMSTIHPVPVQSGGTLTVEFDIPDASSEDELKGIPLKAAVDFVDREQDVNMMLYDMTGRAMSVPGTFKITNGKAVIYLELGHIPSGEYILRAQGLTWSDAKHILVK